MTNLGNSNSDKTEKLKLWHNSETQSDKTQNSKCDKTQNSNCDKTQKLNL